MQRRTVGLRALAFAVASLLVAATSHADRGESTEQTPYTLEPAEVRIGVADVAIGLFGHELLRRIEVGTRPIAWLPYAFGLPSYDVRGKFELWRDDHLSLAVAAEYLRVDLSRFVEDVQDEATVDFSVIPVEAWAGVRIPDRIRINAGVVYTRVAARGSGSAGPLDEIGGGVGTSSAQLRANLDLAVHRSIHLVLSGRFTPWQEQWAEARGREGVGEGGDPAEGDVSGGVRGEGDLTSVGGRAWSVGGELHLTLDHFNLRLGLEYGHYTIPILNFVAAERNWLPVVDLYWRI